MSPPTHLTLDQRKALSGRVLILDAMTPHEVRAFACGEGGTFTTARDSSLVEATSALSDTSSSGGIRLDAFLQGVGETVEEMSRSRQYRMAPITKDALRSARRSLQTINCEECSPGRPCNGTDSDHGIVATSGRCLSRFRNLFDNVRAEVESHFRQYGSGFNTFPIPTVLFQTDFSNRSPHPLPIARFIGGAAEPADLNGQLRSVITLTFGVENFDLESLQATTYVLFHELVCHAFDGTRPGLGPRASPGPADRFAEGWMDWIAGRIYGRVAREGYSLATPPISFSLPDHDRGEHLRQARTQLLTTAVLRERGFSANRTLGSNAARLFEEYLKQLYPPVEALQWLFRVSFDLNLQRGVVDQRQAFVTWVDACLNQQPPVDVLRIDPLLTAFRNYQENRDVSALFP